MTTARQFPIFLIFLIFTVTAVAQAQQATEPPLITVSGQAQMQVVPDEVVFNTEVENTDKDLVAAKRLNDENVRKILAIARSYNIESQNVQTDYISVEPRYESTQGEDRITRRVFLGYAVSKTVVIRLKDISRFEDLFSDVLKAGVTRVRNVEFRTSQLRKYKDQARAMAIKSAQEKAIALTKEIGQTIGRAYSIREESYERPGAMSNQTNISLGGEDSSDEGSTIAPGLISVTARVTVSFRLQ